MHDIFSDVDGTLEGESIVGEAFGDTTNLWYIKEDWRWQTKIVPIRDWTEPIRRMVQTRKRGLTVNFNIHITERSPSNSGFSHNYPVTSFPIQRPLSSSSDDSDNLQPFLFSRSLPPTLKLQIPAPFSGPPTSSPSSFRTARGSLTPPSSRPPSSHWTAATTTPPWPAASPMPLPPQPPTGSFAIDRTN